MYNRKLPLPSLLIIVVAFLLPLNHVLADEDLSQEDIARKFAGKTVNGYHNKKDFHFLRFYSTTGELTEKTEHRGIRKGNWRSKEGKICEFWKGRKEKCREIRKVDGVLQKYDKKGRLAVTYHTFTVGNQITE